VQRPKTPLGRKQRNWSPEKHWFGRRILPGKDEVSAVSYHRALD